jgi:hypothetical protein
MAGNMKFKFTKSRKTLMVASLLVLLSLFLESNALKGYGLSPTYTRQVIQDAPQDFMDPIRNRNSYTNSITFEPVEETCKQGSKYLPGTDISEVSLSSDGKFLNVTLSTHPDVDRKGVNIDSIWNVDYSLHLDIDSVYESGIDYSNSISFNGYSMEPWERETRLGPSIYKENMSGTPEFIGFNVNLEELGYPEQYNIIITTLAGFTRNGINCTLQDVTNFIPLPPPIFELSTSSTPELRPGEEETIEVALKSSALVNALVSFHPFEDKFITTS